MAFKFPSDSWMQTFKDKLNKDEDYARIAKKWEGDIMFQIEAEGPLDETIHFYIDLWHGACREVREIEEEQRGDCKPAYILAAPYGIFAKLLMGEIEPIQAMITRKLRVKGSMSYMMRNVPVVLDFMRCAKEIDTEILT